MNKPCSLLKQCRTGEGTPLLHPDTTASRHWERVPVTTAACTPRIIVSTTTNGIPRTKLEDFQHVPLVGPNEGAERNMLEQMGRQSHRCPLVAHRRQAAQEPLGVRQLPPAGVRGRSRRAAQHLMAQADEGAEVDARDLDQYRVWIHGFAKTPLAGIPFTDNPVEAVAHLFQLPTVRPAKAEAKRTKEESRGRSPGRRPRLRRRDD